MKASFNFSLSACVRKIQSFSPAAGFTPTSTTRVLSLPGTPGSREPPRAQWLPRRDGATGEHQGRPGSSTDTGSSGDPLPLGTVRCQIAAFARAPRCQCREPAGQRHRKPTKGTNGSRGVFKNADLPRGKGREFVHSRVTPQSLALYIRTLNIPPAPLIAGRAG